MGYPDSQNQQGIDELRAILLGEDRQAMDGLREQLADIEERQQISDEVLKGNLALLEELRTRVGDDEALCSSVSNVLSASVAEVEKSNPRPLSRALAPFFVSSIRNEIANSKEAMVEALYPITGRLVSTAVKNSIASMMETINQRVDEATSARMISARFKSWRSGEPVSAYLIANPGDITFHSVMLMERDTGAPICYVDSDGNESSQEGQSNLVSGLLAALSNLTEEVFTGADDELRTIDLNGRKITLRRSLRHLLVVEFLGTMSADQHRAIDEHFAEIVSFSEGDDQNGLVTELSALMKGVKAQSPETQSKKSTGIVVIGLLLASLLIWSAWGGWQRAQLSSAAKTLSGQISESLALHPYPLVVSPDYESKSLLVKGLIPERYDPLALLAQWQSWVPDYGVNASLAPIADAESTKALELEINILRAENRALQLKTSDGFDIDMQSLHGQLVNLVNAKEFVFGPNDQLLNPTKSFAFLSRVSRILKADDGLHVQIVEYNSEQTTDDVSHATRIAEILRELGVQIEQLDIVSRLKTSESLGRKQVILEPVDKTQ